MNRSILVALLAAGTVATPALLASTDLGAIDQPAEPAKEFPSGWEVLERATAARGGAERLGEVENLVQVGLLTIESSGIEGDLRWLEAAPGRLSIVADAGARGRLVQVTDGDKAWIIQPNGQDAERMSGQDREELLRMASFFVETHPRDYYETAETTGFERVGDRECYRVELTFKDGDLAVADFDVETGHRVRFMHREIGGTDRFEVEVVYSDFREVDGIVHPFRTDHRRGGSEFTIEIDSIELNTRLTGAEFGDPNEI